MDSSKFLHDVPRPTGVQLLLLLYRRFDFDGVEDRHETVDRHNDEDGEGEFPAHDEHHHQCANDSHNALDHESEIFGESCFGLVDVALDPAQ